jgi:hypothetical protein
MNHPNEATRTKKIAETLRNELRSCASYIERKFAECRQDDIDDKYVREEILRKATQLQKLSSGANVKKLQAIRSLCASALKAYRNPKNDRHFFDTLEIEIAPLLKRLN